MDVSKIVVNDEDRYCFKNYKTLTDRNGVSFEVVDNEQVFTLTNLQEQRQVYLDMIAAIDEKITAIGAL